MKKNSQAGFTLIELLVVIAIIGILAAVILPALASSREKGADANIKANLANARAQGQIYYDENGGTFYIDGANNVCTSQKGVYKFADGARATAGAGAVVINGSSDVGNAHCNVSDSGWMIQSPMKQLNQLSTISNVDYYCVDSTGASKIEDAPMADFDTNVDEPVACL